MLCTHTLHLCVTTTLFPFIFSHSGQSVFCIVDPCRRVYTNDTDSRDARHCTKYQQSHLCTRTTNTYTQTRTSALVVDANETRDVTVANSSADRLFLHKSVIKVSIKPDQLGHLFCHNHWFSAFSRILMKKILITRLSIYSHVDMRINAQTSNEYFFSKILNIGSIDPLN
jgi:hypothetical protein